MMALAFFCFEGIITISFLVSSAERKSIVMKKSIQDLLALQAVDIRIRNLETRYRTIPGERANIVAEFDVVKKAFSAATAAVQDVEKQIRACQLENATEQENLKKSKIRSGTVKKAAEYEAIMKEIADCETRISSLETKELELYDTLEKVQENAKKAERSYKSTGRLAQSEVRELDALKEKILNEIKQKTIESKSLEKNVAQNVLAMYKRMLASGKGEPVSPIKNGLCGNCSLVLPPMTLNNASKGDLVECDQCSYFLYDPDAKI